ncbi:MAG: thioredoxin family protein [Planctomycetia bacterium]|nr:thioredoxin family protein [Planctomycetia bacterium]
MNGFRIRALAGPTCVAALMFLGGCDASGPEQAPAAGPAAVPIVARGAISFVEGYDRGLALAKNDRRPILVFFTASWCQYCHQMANEAFTQNQVVNLSRQFLCVLVDADAEPQVCRQLNVRGFPTIQFLSPDGGPLHRVVGKRPGQQLVIDMQTALQAVARLYQPGRVLR